MKQHAILENLGRRLLECGLFWMAVFALAAGALFYIPAVAPSNTAPNKELPIYCIQTDKPFLSLTFDAAWGVEDLPTILDILARYDVRATFFVTGDWVDQYPDAVQQLVAAGHDIGNHGNTHAKMSGLTPSQMEAEIMNLHEKVKALTDLSMDLFRPPYGDYNDMVIQTATNCNYYSIQWDVDSLDWKDYGIESIVRTVCQHKHLGNGSIILLHNGATYTAQALEQVIQELITQGYEFVPVSELIYRKDYHMDHEGRQIPDK